MDLEQKCVQSSNLMRKQSLDLPLVGIRSQSIFTTEDTLVFVIVTRVSEYLTLHMPTPTPPPVVIIYDQIMSLVFLLSLTSRE